MSTPVRFAVIVGVNDYSAFDASAGKAPGTSNLRGSVNDAGLYVRLARQLGVSDDNMRVLVAPADGAARPATFDGIPGGLPTQANIEAAFDWLIAQLQANPGTQAILTYSGHGDVEDERLVLCPSDMTQGADGQLQDAVHLENVGGKLDTVAKTNLITVFLDCCHAGDAEQGTRALRPESRTQSRIRMRSNGHPVLAACRPTALSSEISFGDTHFGAFSWAMTQVLGRWQEPDGGKAGAKYGIAYGEAPQRAAMLMNSLAVEQSPMYEGTPEQAHACLFTRADTHVQPPPAEDHRELFPGDTGAYRIYYVYDHSGYHIMSILVTGSNYSGPSTYSKNMEYWTWTSSAVSTLQTTASIQFKNEHTASSTTSNPASHGFSSLGHDKSMSVQSFKQASSGDSFSFNRLFERESGSSALSFQWTGSNDIGAVNWFHKSSGLLFNSTSGGGDLSSSVFYASSEYFIIQDF